MLRALINDLRAQGPLERGDKGVGSLLATRFGDWSGERPLIARPGGYTRTCAYRDATFEVLLLNWAPGAASEIHDHGDQRCWMFVLEGRLAVDDYARLDPGDVAGYAHVEARGSRLLGAGGMDLRSGRFDLHRVSATFERPAISLHIYSGPLRHFLTYDEAARRCQSVSGKYDDVLSVYTAAAHR